MFGISMSVISLCAAYVGGCLTMVLVPRLYAYVKAHLGKAAS